MNSTIMIYYSLRIKFNSDLKIQDIEKILGVRSTLKSTFVYELEQDIEDDYIDFITIFTNILASKFEDLEKIGIYRENIKFWIICNFDEQCNFEFISNDLLELGKNGIGLCITCY